MKTKIRIKKDSGSIVKNFFQQLKRILLLQETYINEQYQASLLSSLIAVLSFALINILFLLTQFKFEAREFDIDLYRQSFVFGISTWLATTVILLAVASTVMIILYLAKRRSTMQQFGQLIATTIFFGGCAVIMVRFSQYIVLLAQNLINPNLDLDLGFAVVSFNVIIPLIRIYAAWWGSRYIVLFLHKQQKFGEIVENLLYLFLLFVMFVVVG